MKSEYPEGAFASGTTTKVRISAIPYYLEGIREGYYIALYVNDAETPLLEAYIADVDSELGDYTKIVMQDLGANYSVKISSAAETPTPAADVMNVTVATSSGKTTFNKPRAGLTLSHFAMEGETVSDLVVEGDATYNAESKMLTFNSEGTVKVYFTVTNAFGTFKSNELAIVYDDGVEDQPVDSSNNQSSDVTSGETSDVTSGETSEGGKFNFNCRSTVGGIGLGALVLAAGTVMLAIKSRKED